MYYYALDLRLSHGRGALRTPALLSGGGPSYTRTPHPFPSPPPSPLGGAGWREVRVGSGVGRVVCLRGLGRVFFYGPIRGCVSSLSWLCLVVSCVLVLGPIVLVLLSGRPQRASAAASGGSGGDRQQRTAAAASGGGR